jgi:hypothetical protein
MSCDDICNKFVANALCGSKRCDADTDCSRNTLCDVLDPDGNPTGVQNECNIPFRCSADGDVCEAASTLTDLQLCSSCCLPQNAGIPCCQVLGIACPS